MGQSLIETALCGVSRNIIAYRKAGACAVADRPGTVSARAQAYWSGCAVTGLKRRELLRASHIRPCADSNNRGRLDSFNGLLLAVPYDAA